MTTLPCSRSDVMFVIWEDAVSEWTRGDLHAAAELRLARNVSLGWIVHENDKRVVLCNGTSTTGEMDHLVIPTSNIVARMPVTREQEAATNPGISQ